MLNKSRIAILAVLASLGVALAAPAEAKVNVGVGIGIGVGGFYPGYGYGGVYVPGAYYEPYYGVSCAQARSIVKGSGFYKVKAIDCSAPSYRFIAWQGGSKYKVRVNAAGNITGVTPL
ncbi:hypothetical protein DK847_05540 [Aestuariivirga litoralis]|uniref:PepSY domain-containing protein n=1 Tax=Aestuariivirga litoralis TaxID=2650924 RepID=A0A2W2AZ39_9HYPH|nr:hypothetical protein [Aestuariivirga litoralis]PZF77890.1 hypothetical protein DK847_05540 [Aestuariivirga litoralis]